MCAAHAGELGVVVTEEQFLPGLKNASLGLKELVLVLRTLPIEEQLLRISSEELLLSIFSPAFRLLVSAGFS